ncbi:MAG: CdvA-like protein [Candidatus Bathyarchaeota archaeon]|nr:MAG: CdvA-like protein [Candidatus Bathyarchaeota archaeon]
MISWKYSFQEIGKDLELTKKKKQALDDLFQEGKISQSTYEALNIELTGAIIEVEARRKAITEKITSKISELEQQITVLEMFLANSEIEYVAGEIDEELHQRETSAFALGLEATKQELDSIKESLSTLVPEEPLTTPTSPSEATEEVEKEELVETQPEIAAEALPELETVSEEPLTEELTEAPTEEAFVEEVTEISEEVPSDVTPEEPPEEASVEEQFQPSEETAEQTIEEITDPSEIADGASVEEAPTEEEAAAEEGEYWE